MDSSTPITNDAHQSSINPQPQGEARNKASKLFRSLRVVYRGVKANLERIFTNLFSQKQPYIMNGRILKNGDEGNPLSFVADYHRWGPISSEVFRHLDISTALNLSKTCRALSGTFKHYQYHNCNINHRLRLFVEDPLTLRQMLADAGAIMSGSFALSFFSPLEDFDITLEIWVKRTNQNVAPAARMIAWLTEQEGYIPTRLSQPIDYHSVDGVQRAHALVRSNVDRERPRYKILVIETHLLPLRSILSLPTSSHLLNIITASNAYSLYPRETFIAKEMHLINPWRLLVALHQSYSPTQSTPICRVLHGHQLFFHTMSLYFEYGWSYATNCAARKRSPFKPWVLRGVRALQDSNVLRIPLDTQGVIRPENSLIDTEKYLMSATWDVETAGDVRILGNESVGEDPISYARFSVRQFAHPCLKYYSVGGHSENPLYISGDDWQDFIDRFQCQSWAEFLLRKLSICYENHGDELEEPLERRQDVQEVFRNFAILEYLAESSREIAEQANRMHQLGVYSDYLLRNDLFLRRRGHRDGSFNDLKVPGWFEEWMAGRRKAYETFLRRKVRGTRLSRTR